MGLQHRKLMPEPCQFRCNESCSGCANNPPLPIPPLPPGPPLPGPPPKDEDEGVGHSNKHHKISTFMILSVSLVSATFLLVCCYAIYARFFRSRVSRRQIEEIRDDFLDEEHGPVLDHPIWYIRTNGLQQSIISAITVCKYKKGEGLIEGTECSVCLSEFQEDENLRLLPKCNHAFHLPCIDTWLRSHTNCPMCRAPIVTDPATWATTVPSLEPNVVDSSSMEMEVLENGGETSEGMENTQTGDAQLRDRAEEEGQLEVDDERRRVIETENSASEVVNMIQPRRSVSLDASSAAKINLALSTVVSVESHGNASKRVMGNGNLRSSAKGSSSSRTRHLHSAPSSMKRSRSYNGKHPLSRSSSSQKKPNTLVRSF